MVESESIYPRVKSDRRRRSRARPDYSDRRRDMRYKGEFPVEIHVGKGKDAKVYKGVARDVSNGGLLLEAPDVPKDETRFRLEFKLPDGSMPEEFIHQKFKTEVEVRRRDSETSQLGVQFEEPLSRKLARHSWRLLRASAVIFLLAAVLFILIIKYQNLYFFWFDVPIFLYSLMVGVYLLSRFFFAAFYRVGHPRADTPPVTVIVPVFNEEEHIERTITQIMESAYPAEKLQVIVVNDGSTDGTLAAIQRTRESYPEVILVSFDESRGKRHALAAGVRMSTGDVCVFTDSDSFLEPDALRNLIQKLSDDEVAAVTGHCEVENQWTNVLTRMQAVRYYVAFRIIKAAESVFGCVTCLSGPLSVYKKDVLMEVLDDWVSQTFMGRPATYGDDRALTNALLRRGYKAVYESSARMTTVVPERWGEFMKQQMRWKRSWLRESLRACAFMWRKEPLMSLSFYLGFLLPILAPIVVIRALIYGPVFEQASPLTYIFGVFLMSTLMSSTYLFVKRSRLWLYGIHFCFFYMFVLVWQIPWAVVTIASSDWGTRS